MEVRVDYETLVEIMQMLHSEACWVDDPNASQQPWIKLSSYDVNILAWAIASVQNKRRLPLSPARSVEADR